MIKIIIADDHPLIRKGIKDILEDEMDYEVVADAAFPHEVLNGIKDFNPDILITDLSMPGRSGLDMISDVKQLYPKLPILVLTMHPEERFAVRALRAGVDGYLTKDTRPEEIIKAVRQIVSGRKFITPSIAEKLATEIDRDPNKLPHELLSDREFQVMCMIAAGEKVRNISSKLSLSIRTVHTYRTRILEKMNMKSDTELTLYAMEHRLLD
ncbi:MAG: response regulator [Ignavibacteriales bacterium]